MPEMIEGGKGICIGIDPGASGGLVSITFAGEVLSAVGMPITESDIWHWFHCFLETPEEGPFFAVIEQVGGYVPRPSAEGGAGGQPGSAMFKFGFSYGGLRMALTTAQIPFEQVVPRTWQKGLGIASKGKDESRTSFKNRLKSKAQQLFPDIKVTLATADALLLAEYCRRKRTGTL